jgi:hypothetical protein
MLSAYTERTQNADLNLKSAIISKNSSKQDFKK